MMDYRMGSGLFTPQSRQFVEDFREKYPMSVSEAVNLVAGSYVKDAAGSTIAIQLKANPILNMEGSSIGSFWGDPGNQQYEKQLTEVVKTDGAATCTVSDDTYDLEKLFESTGKGRYMAKVHDTNGRVLYGWIGGVAKSTNLYTFSVYSDSALGTNNWFQGGTATFTATQLATLQIYKYTSSISLGSSDTFSEEVGYSEDSVMKEIDILKALSNGQYAVDYKRGRVLARKLNADDTETFTYLTYPLYPIILPSTSGSGLPPIASLIQTMTSGSKAVAAGPTATKLSATTLPVRKVIITARATNAATIWVGDSAGAGATGTPLIQTDRMELDYVDLTSIYIYGTAGDIVYFNYLT